MSRKSKSTRRVRKRVVRKVLVLGVISLVIIVGTIYTTGKYWIEIYDKYQEKKQLQAKLVKLKEKEEVLRVDANRLQDPNYIARYAREKYSYSKDGEIILKLP